MATIENTSVPPQPGSPDQAHHWLPLGQLGTFLLLGAIFCIVATLGFVWLALGIFANRFVTLDDRLILGLNHYWSPSLNAVMLFFTTMGESLVLGTFVALAAVALFRKRRWIDAGALIVASAGGGILNQLLKVVYQRVRPDLVQGPFHLTSYSFPSGHSMGSMVCYGMLAYLGIHLVRSHAAKVGLGLVAALLIFCIGLSRVYFGVHFPTDVLGGFTAGLIWLVVSIGMLRVAEWYAERRHRMRSQ